MENKNKCWNRFYMKSGKSVKPFILEFLKEDESGGFLIDFEKVAPVPEPLANVPEFKGPENVDTSLMENYKNNVAMFGLTDSVKWKENYWGGQKSLYKGEFSNEDKFYDFWTEFNPAVMIAEFLSMKLEEGENLVLDYKNDDPENGFYGRYMTRSQNENESFFMSNKPVEENKIEQVSN